MPTEKKKIGNKGEEKAVDYLKQHGFIVKDQNYWKPWGEIDIVVEKNGVLHFVEVKAMTKQKNQNHLDFYEAEEHVTLEKRKKLTRIIESYLLEKKISEDVDYQVDLIAIYFSFDGETKEIRFFEDIVL